jgi:hypothetical protein
MFHDGKAAERVTVVVSVETRYRDGHGTYINLTCLKTKFIFKMVYGLRPPSDRQMDRHINGSMDK